MALRRTSDPIIFSFFSFFFFLKNKTFYRLRNQEEEGRLLSLAAGRVFGFLEAANKKCEEFKKERERDATDI